MNQVWVDAKTNEKSQEDTKTKKTKSEIKWNAEKNQELEKRFS